MKSARLRFKYRKNASKLHRLVGDILRAHPCLGGYRIYQEYPIPGLKRAWVDWYIKDINVAIECHGQQHREAVKFGGRRSDQAKAALESQQSRDQAKYEAMVKAGWKVVEVWYDEDITPVSLFERVYNKMTGDQDDPTGPACKG